MAIDLFKTQLCRHGPSHPLSGCRFAHSLAEVRRPEPRDEISWARVHFYLGQKWEARTIRLFKHYVCVTPLFDIPSWAWVAIWLHFGYPLLWQPFAGVDFGLYERARRYDGSGPIPDSALRHKMQLRSVAMAPITAGDYITGQVEEPISLLRHRSLPRTASRARSSSSYSSRSPAREPAPMSEASTSGSRSPRRGPSIDSDDF